MLNSICLLISNADQAWADVDNTTSDVAETTRNGADNGEFDEDYGPYDDDDVPPSPPRPPVEAGFHNNEEISPEVLFTVERLDDALDSDSDEEAEASSSVHTHSDPGSSFRSEIREVTGERDTGRALSGLHLNGK